MQLENKQFGNYRLTKLLGRGGMAEVWLAMQVTLNREVALKVLNQRQDTENNFVQRFEREAQAVARLEHPVILPVIDYGQSDGYLYIVTPYIRGGNLQEQINRQPLSRGHAFDLFDRVLGGLAFAHRKGILHRDLKPSNILLHEDGRPIIADFGLAKTLTQSIDVSLTETGVILGSPAYMAPEQFMGYADVRSDLYSMGVILYQLLTGHIPYSGTTALEIGMRHMNDPLPLPHPQVPPALEAFLAKALQKHSENRFATAEEMGAGFHAAASLLTPAELALRPVVRVGRPHSPLGPYTPGPYPGERMQMTPTPTPTPGPFLESTTPSEPATSPLIPRVDRARAVEMAAPRSENFPASPSVTPESDLTQFHQPLSQTPPEPALSPNPRSGMGGLKIGLAIALVVLVGLIIGVVFLLPKNSTGPTDVAQTTTQPSRPPVTTAGVSTSAGANLTPGSPGATTALPVTTGSPTTAAPTTAAPTTAPTVGPIATAGLPTPAPLTRLNLTGHAGPINMVSWSPDGRSFVTASDDKTLKIWDTNSGKPTLTLDDKNNPNADRVLSAAWSSDGQYVVFGTADKFVKVYSLKTQAVVDDAKANQAVTSVVMPPDTASFIPYPGPGELDTWHFVQSNRGPKLPLDNGVSVTALAYAPDGKYLAVGLNDGRVVLWDVAADKAQTTARGNLALPDAGPVVALSWTPNGKTLVVGSQKGLAVYPVDVAAGTLGKAAFSQGVPGTVQTLALSADGSRVALGSTSGEVQLFSLETNKRLNLFSSGTATILGLHWSADKEQVQAVVGGAVPALLSFSANRPAARSLKVSLRPLNNTKVIGTGVITEGDDGTVTVTLQIENLDPGQHLAHVHEGSCLQQGPIVYPLTPLQAGPDGKASSTATFKADFNSITGGRYYLNVHNSQGDAIPSASCGEITT